MRPLRTLGMMLLSLTLGGAAAAQNNGSRSQTLQPGDRQQTSQRGAAWLQNQVRKELVMLPFLSVFDHLQFKIDGDKVTLLGEVSRPSLKSDAENVVKKIEGVATVDNRIEVLPNSPSDDRLRVALYRSIFGDSALYRYAMQVVPPIQIIVNNGRVTLEGVVDNAGDKNFAYIRANSVPGVFSVTNNLQVEKESR